MDQSSIAENTSVNDSKENNHKVPTAWRRWDVLLASLFINLTTLALPLVILQVYDRILPNKATDTFSLLIFGLLVAAILDGVLRVARSAILTWKGVQYEHTESIHSIERVVHADLVKFESNSIGSYLDKMEGLKKVREFYSGQSILMLVDLPFVLIFLSLIFLFAGKMVLIPITIIAIFIVVSYYTGKKLKLALEQRSSADERRQNFLIETLQGIHTVKAMAMEALMLRRYERLQAQSAASVYEVSRINSFVSGLGATFSQVVMVFFVGIGSIYVVAGELTVGALAAGTMLSGRVLQPALKAMGLWTQLQAVHLAGEDVNDILTLPHEALKDNSLPITLDGEIELEDVCFQHEGSNVELLSGVSLHIKPGEAIGILGANGVGKTTLINLIMGFVNPTQGAVLLNGKDIQTLDGSSVRAQIALMPQQGTIYDGTILDNLTLFREGYAVDQAIELAEIFGLTKAITKLPNGLDTRIGGANVDAIPAGVRQQIILVRSMVGDATYGDPRIILFDDANSCLDFGNEARLQNYLQENRKGLTMVIISHRPSLLNICDRHFRLEGGKLESMQFKPNKNSAFENSKQVINE
jgi:ATP-binding cassette subfamily C protein LapB